jgi:hypothetical protein
MGGPFMSSYYVFISPGPAVPNGMMTSAGIVNVDPTNSFLLRFGVTTTNIPPGGGCAVDAGDGCGFDLFFIETVAAGLPAGTIFTIQGLVFSDTLKCELTNAIEYRLIP